MQKIIKVVSTTILLAFSSSVLAVDWDVSVWGKRRAFTENIEKLAELVAERSNGDFTLSISYGGLSKSRENLDGISIGAFSIAQFCSFYHVDKNPTITVTELPFSQQVSLAKIADIYTKVYQHPAVAKDLARWDAMLLMPSPLPQYNIIGKGDAVQQLTDFKGMRVRAPGGIAGVLGQYDAVRTSVPFSEVRQAMDSGVIDGAAFAPHAHLATKTYKNGNWVTTNLNLGSANCPVVVNINDFNSLSDKNQKILLDSAKDAVDFYVQNYDNNIDDKYQHELDKAGLEKVTFTAQQTAEFQQKSKIVVQNWIDKYADQFDSQALYDFTAELYSQ